MNSEIKEKMKNIDGNIIVNGDIQSGKTTNLIFNSVDSIIDKNESLLVVDSKEEYLNNYFAKLKEKGYNIIILNLRELDKSVGWNPLEYPYSLYKNGNKDKAVEEIQNIGNVIFREDVNTDPFWCKTSADFFTGITLGLFEDGKKEEINFNSINCMFNGMDTKYGLEDYTTNYFKLKDSNSSAYNFASSTFLAPRETKGSILSVARQKLRLLTSREKLSILLSNTTFDMKEIVNKPTALFIINKDENTYINLVATLFIEQVYNYLFDIKEKNRFNFILDNFDSLSNFNDLSNMIGAGITRNMRFVIGTRYKEKLLSTFGDYILRLVTNIDVKSKNIEITRNGEKNSYSYEPIYVNISNNDITYRTLSINPINTFDVIKYVQEKKGECLFDSIDNNKLPIPPISNDLPPVPNVDELIKSIDKKIEELTLEEETEKLFNNNDDYFKSDLEQFKTE